MSLTQEKLKEILKYDPDSGHFTWLISTGTVRAGRRAGRLNKGYIGIQINNVKYSAHRLVFLYMTGKMPEELVDHINEVKSDNRYSNLRLASKAQNNSHKGKQKSNSSGYKGVTWSKTANKWISRITHHGIIYQLGRYDTPEEAYQAYLSRAKVIHGEFFHP